MTETILREIFAAARVEWMTAGEVEAAYRVRPDAVEPVTGFSDHLRRAGATRLARWVDAGVLELRTKNRQTWYRIVASVGT